MEIKNDNYVKSDASQLTLQKLKNNLRVTEKNTKIVQLRIKNNKKERSSLNTFIKDNILI